MTTLFDPEAYRLHHQRAARDFRSFAFLFDYVGGELTSRLEDIKRNFMKVLNISPHPLPYPSLNHSSLDDSLPFSERSFDLILSCLHFHWINNPPALLKSIHGALEGKGLFLGALWGGNTLCELRESMIQAELALRGGVSPRVAPLLHPSDAPHLLKKCGFAMPVVDREVLTVTYPSLASLMKDLRGMGETNKMYDRPKTFTPRCFFKKTEEIYRATYEDLNQSLPATFEVIYLAGWKDMD